MTFKTFMKKWYRSKTVLVAAAIAGLGALQVNINVVPDKWQGYVLIAISVLMVILRSVTTQPLEDK